MDQHPHIVNEVQELLIGRPTLSIFETKNHYRSPPMILIKKGHSKEW